MPDSSFAMEARPCHRHWVIWPLFLSAIAASSLGAGRLERPAVTPVDFSERGGETLVQDDGMIAFSVDDRVFSGMHGAFTVSAHDGHASTAALTTPVLVREGDSVSIVPVGFQWRSDGQGVILQIPSAFHYARLQELRGSSSSSRAARWQASFVLPDALRLPAARRRREDAVTMKHLAALARQIARGRPVARMTRDGGASAALASEDGYRIIPSLLAELQDAPLDRAALFPFLFQEEEGALLALFHPDFRDHASALLPPGALSAEARAAYRLSFPRSDLLPQALAASTFSRWEDDVTERLSEADSPQFFAALLGVIEDVVRACAQRGYVERAERYTAAMQHFATLVELTPELQGRVDALPVLAVPPGQSVPLADSSASSAPSLSSMEGSEPVAWDDLRERAIVDLTVQGAMFIAQTTMEPVSPASVRVVSLALAMANGDELFDFIYDVEKREVSDIIRGSARYPYAVPLSRFVLWVRST